MHAHVITACMHVYIQIARTYLCVCMCMYVCVHILYYIHIILSKCCNVYPGCTEPKWIYQRPHIITIVWKKLA